MRPSRLLVLACSGLLACGGSGDSPVDPSPPDPLPPGQPPPGMGLALEVVAQGMDQPLFLAAPPGDTRRLFIVERPGRIRIIEDGVQLGTPFLDITSLTSLQGERGLLGMAFHPDHDQNGQVFVHYTAVGSGGTRIARYTVSADPNVADAGSGTIVLTASQPFSNHNGGAIAFGPDGMLYIALGDGGSGGDPLGHGQNLGSLLGSVLRIDVDSGAPFVIPATNPFVGQAGARGEIWAYGLRNPWRMSFDRATGDLYIADVGQSDVEEVDVQLATSSGGENYGWNIMEGSTCFGAAACQSDGLVLPVAEYTHEDGCSITGGYVYRGTAISSIVGRYFYGDFCSGFVRSFLLSNGQATDPIDHTSQIGPGGSIVSFGEDGAGELYVITIEGSVFRLVAG